MEIGFYGEYIHDLNYYGFSTGIMCKIPEHAAVGWVQQAIPDSPKKPVYNEFLQLKNWTNKGYFVVAEDRHGWIAIYQHDGEFFLYMIREKQS